MTNRLTTGPAPTSGRGDGADNRPERPDETITAEPLTDADRFARLLHGRHPAVLIVTDEEEYAARIVLDGAARVKRQIHQWTAVRGAYDGLAVYAAQRDTENPAAALYHFIATAESDSVCILYDLLEFFEDARVLRAWRELVRRMKELGATAVLIDHVDSAPRVVRSEATSFDLSLPDEAEIERIVRRTLRRMHREVKIEVQLTTSMLATMVKNLRGLSRRNCEQIIIDAVAIDRKIDEDDLNHVLAEKRTLLHRDGLLAYIESPVDLDEIGGLLNLKSWLKKRASAFSEDAEAFGLTPPRGVLMLGVQGAGKSLCAKAIATAWQRPLLRLDPGALYDRYVGESERRLREALRQTEMMAPIVLWIDEIEKGFASAASRSTDGGLSQRMFGTLLTWMQEHEAPVFLVATANDIEALPPELLRKGRFDEIFFVDLPDDRTRAEIFAIHLRKRGRKPDEFDLEALAQASEGYSGAEIEQALISALHEAFATGSPFETALIIETVEHSPPLSVTMAEKMQQLRAWARGRCVPAG